MKLISFEGIDGSGKTTLCSKVAEHYTKAGFRVVSFREPGGSTVAEEIRRVVKTHKMEQLSQSLLFLAARRELVNQLREFRDSFDLILLDRFDISTLVYQLMSPRLSDEEADLISKLNNHIIEDFIPDATVYVYCDPEVAAERTHQRDRKLDAIEMTNDMFEIAKRYEYAFSVLTGRDVVRIDNTSDFHGSERQIYKNLDALFSLNSKTS